MKDLLAPFHYCPRCGSTRFETNDWRSRRCADCGFTFFVNASASATAFIVSADGRNLLVCRRAFDPARDTLDLPGGFVNPGETLEEACLREVEEETGCRAVLGSYLFSGRNVYPFGGLDVHTVDAFFLATLPDGSEPRPADDAAELFWQPLDCLRPELFGLPSVRRAVERFLAELPTCCPEATDNQ